MLSPALATAQDAAETDVDKRFEELSRRIDAVSDDVERTLFGDLVPDVGDSQFGFGPAASKVYSKDQGFAIGGYGETLFDFPAGAGDTFDNLRAVTYIGYKFNDKWLFNSELEFEHAGTGGGGSVSTEFAYVEYAHSEEIGFRGGLVLVPMGFINELHEPTTFLSANRPDTESKIIPSTWRENGIGVFGEVGPVTYRAYAINGLDGAKFSSGGLRGGRQKGSRAKADDIALVARVDYDDIPGAVFGGSFYVGDSGQEQIITQSNGTTMVALPDAKTTIYEIHAEVQSGGFYARGLAAMGEVDDVTALNNALELTGSASIGSELEGYYVEVGYDLASLIAPESGQSVTPFVRYEAIDTQADVPSGFTSSPANDEEIVTFGVQWKPVDQVVVKIDYQDRERGTDGASIVLGYIF